MSDQDIESHDAKCEHCPEPGIGFNDDGEFLCEDCLFEDGCQSLQDDGSEPGEECGRWSNGRLTKSCSKAGSEECDFECPYRDSL